MLLVYVMLENISLQCKFNIQFTNYLLNQNVLLVNNLFNYAILVLSVLWRLFSCFLLNFPPSIPDIVHGSHGVRLGFEHIWKSSNSKVFKTTVFGTSMNVSIHLWFFFITSCMLKFINVLVSVKSVTKHLLEIKNYQKWWVE